MAEFEVPQPILNTPYDEPARYWFIQEGHPAEKREGRRASVVFPPRDQKRPWDISDGILRPSEIYFGGYELTLVNRIREQVNKWRAEGWPGATRTTRELLQYWRRDGRARRLFFAQIEAAETVIFLKEARTDYLQGINVPRDEPSDERKAEGLAGFERIACKMATGSGKTTVMGMLAAWSILNKVNDRGDKRFSDVILIVAPNVTIRDRLAELDPKRGNASLYRTRDLVPRHMMQALARGRVLVRNWHAFQKLSQNTGGTSAKVVKTGVQEIRRVKIQIGSKSTTARGSRYLTMEDFELQTRNGMLEIAPGTEQLDKSGNLVSVHVIETKYVESDTAMIDRVLGTGVGGKRNILVFNDEAHHAYRIRRKEDEADAEGFLPEDEDSGEEEEDAEDFFKEANVWMDGLDRLNKMRGMNFCLDLSATPYFLGRVGQETNKPFPWVVSDFGLIDAIESGLTKIPQLPRRDTTGEDQAQYTNIWRWIMQNLTAAERGGKRASPKPAAILKWAHTPIAMLGGRWEVELTSRKDSVDPRPPVFILVCKNIKIAKAIFEWLAEGKQPAEIPDAKIEGLRNRDGMINTIRVDSKVVQEDDTATDDGKKWQRFVLDSVGKTVWPVDDQGRPVYPEGFEELANKLERPLHPPGRDIRCIVSVGMLTEGWDCNTVTHIVGLRPFMSQLLCEQVVGRGLRRMSYEPGDDGLLPEEVATIFGVPFEVVPFKATEGAPVVVKDNRKHVYAVGAKAKFEIRFPRVEGYTQAIRNRVSVDWANVPPLQLEPGKIPPEVEAKGMSVTNKGKLALSGPGKTDLVTLEEYRAGMRVQGLSFVLARGLTDNFSAQGASDIPKHVLFPQMQKIAERYLREKVQAIHPANVKDVSCSPYYGWLVEILTAAIHGDTTEGETPEVPVYEAERESGSTADVDFMTSRDVREVIKCHLNYIVADTKQWEQSAAAYIDKHNRTEAFVKNAGLGFAIPYIHNGQPHDYIPDFIIRLIPETEAAPDRHLILETKGYDPLAEIKAAAAVRWTKAVNADGQHGQWTYAVARKPEEVPGIIDAAFTGAS